MSKLLMNILTGEYIVIMAASAWQGKPILALYWFGAIILNVAITIGL